MRTLDPTCKFIALLCATFVLAARHDPVWNLAAFALTLVWMLLSRVWGKTLGLLLLPVLLTAAGMFFTGYRFFRWGGAALPGRESAHRGQRHLERAHPVQPGAGLRGAWTPVRPDHRPGCHGTLLSAAVSPASGICLRPFGGVGYLPTGRPGIPAYQGGLSGAWHPRVSRVAGSFEALAGESGSLVGGAVRCHGVQGLFRPGREDGLRAGPAAPTGLGRTDLRMCVPAFGGSAVAVKRGHSFAGEIFDGIISLPERAEREEHHDGLSVADRSVARLL